MGKIEDIADFYKAHFEVYQAYYADRSDISACFIVLGGIISKMQSDVLEYRCKSPNDKRVMEVQKRINDMLSVYDKLSAIDSENLRLRAALKRSIDEKAKLEYDRDKLQEQVQNFEKLWNETK